MKKIDSPLKQFRYAWFNWHDLIIFYIFFSRSHSDLKSTVTKYFEYFFQDLPKECDKELKVSTRPGQY